jgi:hypothetical protein
VTASVCRSRLRPFLAVFALAIVSAQTMEAQEKGAAKRRGAWISVGYGFAQNNMECTGCEPGGANDPWRGGPGGGVVVGAGGAITSRFLLGAELNVSGAGGEDRNSSILTLQGVGRFYPWDRRGLYLSVGAGMASARVFRTGGSAEAYGWGTHVGVGYDVHIPRARSLALTPYARYVATSIRDGNVTAFGNMTDVTALQNKSVVQLGLAVSWY